LAPPAVHIIDDDDAVRDSLAVLLETHGFETAGYASAPEFLTAVDAGLEEGCVVTDVQMPPMSGLELLAALRIRRNALPVIVVTARSGRALAAEALALGAQNVIEKPFTPGVLVAAVRELLD
jgi:two-component system response regulator FixJ